MSVSGGGAVQVESAG